MTFKPESFTSDVWVDHGGFMSWWRRRRAERRGYWVPSHYDTSDEPKMIQVSEAEIARVLAWRIHDVQRQVAELRDAERVR